MGIDMAKAYNLRRNTREDFFNRIIKQDNGCWEFQSHYDKNGYTFFQYQGKNWRAHRLSVMFDGRDPQGKIVCHHCDNPRCVNPEHLFLGTSRDNTIDRINKGRSRGNTSDNRAKGILSKLTDKVIYDIQNSTESQVSIANRLNIHKSTVAKYKKLLEKQ
jgi:hypothetical protein